MNEKKEQEIFKEEETWYERHHLITPENFALAITLISIFPMLYLWKCKKIDSNAVPILVPLAVPIVTQPIAAFFGRLRENRDLDQSKKVENIRQLRESSDYFFQGGQNLLMAGKFYQAEENNRLILVTV